MEKILVSKCLLGENVRYDGGHKSLRQHHLIQRWLEEGRFVSVCPEVQSGMPVPRPASEIVGVGGGKAVLSDSANVVTKEGDDVTKLFKKGAEIALALAKKNHIKVAILKEGSPSCGSNRIYDGGFSKISISGEGVTAALLRNNDIAVFNENEIEEVEKYLFQLENGVVQK